MKAPLLFLLCGSSILLAAAAKSPRAGTKAKPSPRRTTVAAPPSPSPTPTGVRMLALSSGGLAVPLDLSLDVRVAPVKPAPSPAPEPTKLGWHEANGAWIGNARGAVWQAALTLTVNEGSVDLDAEIDFEADVDVEKTAIRIRMPGGASAVTRALAWKPVDEIRRVDTGTPILVASSALGISGGKGFIAARYLPGHWRNGTFVDTELILDDAAAHPFSTYDECLEKLPADENDPNAVVNWTELEKRTARDHLTMLRGSSFHGHAILFLRDDHPDLPLLVERWPGGARAAIVFTDHADRTDPAALRAVLYGTSDEKSDDFGKKGFFGHHLSLTKTFFAHGSRVGGLENDPEARTLADEIVARESEVGSHSITQGVDTRDAVRKGLASFDAWTPQTWIDHEPYTNCEALSNLGWKNAAPYGIRDLLVEKGYRWVWAATDLPGSKDAKLIDLFGGAPADAAPPLFAFPPDPRLEVFRSVWFYAPPATLARALDDKRLDAFVETRGLFVGHTYLSASLATTKSDVHKADLVVKKNEKTGALEIDGRLDEALARLETRQKAGTLCVLPWRDVGVRLDELRDIEVRYLPDGAALVTNRGDGTVFSLTVSVPGDVELSASPRSDIAPAFSPTRHEPGRSTMWFDVKGRDSVVVRATHGEPSPPLLGTRPATLVPR